MNNDVEGLQVQVGNTSNRLDTALHKLAEYQRVVAGVVKDGVYRNDNYWWHELKRLANEQAVEPDHNHVYIGGVCRACGEITPTARR